MQERHQASEWVMWSSKYCSLGLHLDSPAPEIKLFFPTVTVQPSVSMYVCIYLCRETWLKYHFLIGLQPNRGGYSELFQLFLKLEPEKHERISPPPSLVVVDAHVWAQSNHLVLECKFLKLPFHMSKKKIFKCWQSYMPPGSIPCLAENNLLCFRGRKEGGFLPTVMKRRARLDGSFYPQD